MKIDRHPLCHPDRPYFAKDQCKQCYYKKAGQEYRIKHPGYGAITTAKWRRENLVKAAVLIKRANEKWQGKLVHKRLARLDWQRFGNQKFHQKAILNEVAHHLRKNRSPSAIAVWMNKPMSIVNKAIEQLQQSL